MWSPSAEWGLSVSRLQLKVGSRKSKKEYIYTLLQLPPLWNFACWASSNRIARNVNHPFGRRSLIHAGFHLSTEMRCDWK